MDLGTTIKNIRKQKALSQKELADRCGISQTYLSQIEKNQKQPNYSRLVLISNGLKIPLPILFFLSMTEEDVQPQKRKAFHIISPSVKSILNEFLAV
ncbi:MAG TPA: helix-turn-helix transcriptional regulator [Bacteroidia bacterium]|nr:helix-turn-helix transcriptional regulator [Bacteroidia bacterium]